MTTQPAEDFDARIRVYGVRYVNVRGDERVLTLDGFNQPFTLTSARDYVLTHLVRKSEGRATVKEIEVVTTLQDPWRAVPNEEGALVPGDRVRHTGGMRYSGIGQVLTIYPDNQRAMVQFGTYKTRVGLKYLERIDPNEPEREPLRPVDYDPEMER